MLPNQPKLPERFSRVEQKLRDLARRQQEARQLTGQISATSEETAALFSGGTTPAVRMTMESR